MNPRLFALFPLSAVALAVSFALTGCGGDDDVAATTQSSTDTAPATLKGVLLDSAVEGVTYFSKACPKGCTTNAKGEFSYLKDDEVAFKIGDLNIGKASGSTKLFLNDLTGEANILGEKTVALATLLQSLDKDGNPDNGITLDNPTLKAGCDFTKDLKESCGLDSNKIKLRDEVIAHLLQSTLVNADIKSVEFSSTPVATTEADMLKTYTTSVATVTMSDGSTKTYPLSYNTLFKNTDEISVVNGKKYAAAQVYDMDMTPIKDPNGDMVIAETADANSLLKVGNKLFLVNHWEYDDVLTNGQTAYKVANWYTRMPMSMGLSSINQSSDGKLSVASQTPVDFKSVNGGWIFCYGGPTPWNTHLGGEEDYDLYFVPGEKSYSTTTAGLKAMTEVYFKNTQQANPYHYGYPIEVAVKEDGSKVVTKHYGMGRGTWEMARFAADGRTAIFGDDGAYSGLFMFVGNKQNDPKAGGSLYAAKWNQTSPDGEDGGTADITWIKLGSANYDEIKKIIDSGITLTDIFETSLTEQAGFIPTRAGSYETIWLKLKPGMEKAAAYLETRRYAAYKGATTEFTKGEGVAFNEKDKKMYYAISYTQSSMLAKDGGPVDHIRVKANNAGATYTFDLASNQNDTNGAPINSAYVATKAYVEPALLGKPIPADANGNIADVNSISNTDNIFFSEKMRTLFVGEDSGNHVNNYVWAYNVDTKKLSRILSVAAGAESTGLQVVDDMNGYAYIMSNNQHQGDWIKSQNKDLTGRLDTLAKSTYGTNKYGVSNYRLTANVGYIGGLPAIK